MQPDDTSPPPADHTPLLPAADTWCDVLGDALLAWLRANRALVLKVLEGDDARG